jgi:hypothetical protein
LGDGVAAKIDNAHEPGLKSAGEIPLRSGITAVIAWINQPLRKEKSFRTARKFDGNHQKGAMHRATICVKNAALPEKGRRKRSQGGVQFPTGGNCAQCA